MKWQQIEQWNHMSYGSAYRVKRSHMIMVGVIFCIITPCTNWLIPFLGKIIKNDYVVRYE